MRENSVERDCTSSCTLRVWRSTSALRRGSWEGRRAVSFMMHISTYSLRAQR